jgi:hypothetical protein
VIEDKINRYKSNLEIAQKLINHDYADKLYYQELIYKMKKMLSFYQTLKDIRNLD